MSGFYNTPAEYIQKIANMPDGNGLRVGNWCAEGRNDFSAYCSLCKTFFRINYSGKYYKFEKVLSHASGMKHRIASKIKRESEKNDDEIIDEPTMNFCSTNQIQPSNIQPLSEYEKKLEEKRAKNREMFHSFRIQEAKQELGKAVNHVKEEKIKNMLVKLGHRPDPVVQRASKRLKDDVSYVISRNSMSDSTLKSFRKVIKSNTDYEKFEEDFKEILTSEKKDRINSVLYDKDILRNMEPEFHETRGVNNPSAMSWFPSSTKLVLAVGDDCGNLTFINIKESCSNCHVFSPHSEKISHLQYNPCDPFKLISSSIDGKLLCCDMQAQIFTEVLSSIDGSYTCFDFISPSSYIVSLMNGHIIVADSREQKEFNVPSQQQKNILLHNLAIHTVQMHPVDKNIFVTAAKRENQFCIWDLRKLYQPLVKKTCHSKFVWSAAFSPVSGKYTMSTSKNEICIYDSTILDSRDMKCPNKMEMFKSITRPVWLPNSDNLFACTYGNSYKLHILDTDLNIYAKVFNDTITNKTIVNFHPYQSVFACSLLPSKIAVFV